MTAGNKKKRKRMTGILLTVSVAAVLSLGGIKTGKAEAQEMSDQLLKIVVGVDSYPPFDYISVDGDFIGIDVELAKEAFSRIGYEPEFVTIDWERKNALLEDGTIDCIWCSFTMKGREDLYKWAGPYMVSNQVVAVRPDSDIYTLQDLKDKNIAVQTTTKPEEIFLSHEDSRIPELHGVLSFQNRELIYATLDKGYADAIAGHETSIRQYMKDYNREYRILDEPLDTVGLGVAFSLDDNRNLDRELTTVLEDMRTDGTSKEIISKYLDDADKYLEVGSLEK